MSISADLRHKIEQSKVLLVGAGGIGCEVLKNLTLSGFRSIDAIDLDTIDVSNLNRQFLFNKTNVGQSKAKVAIEIAKSEYIASQDGLNMNAIHKSIMLDEFDVDFFKQYTFVINALDNRAARSHVNRMCLAADIPLLESGTAGYTGQSKLIKNSLTACYECDGIQKEGRTYATCTIRNTPSQPIHCIVWAKHLFHQLFGEDDPDNDVSPQVTDDALAPIKDEMKNGTKENGHTNDEAIDVSINGNTTGGSDSDEKKSSSEQPKTTRDWAEQNSYDPALLFHKLFNVDIKYLLSMENLWKNRTKPTPLDYLNLINEQEHLEQPSCSKDLSNHSETLERQRLWSLKECVTTFSNSIVDLHRRMKLDGYQSWDKDDDVALNFVVAASNLRSKCFNIERKSPFDVKSLAGNIVPAISSTNSIIGGLLVLQAFRLLKSMPLGEKYLELDTSARNECLKGSGRLSYLNFTSLARSDLIASFECSPPVPDCLACAKGNIPEIGIHLDMNETTLGDIVDKIIIGTFHFVCPDLSLNDDSGTIIWSKDEGDEEEDILVKKKKLVELPHIKPPKTRLMITDLLQDKQLVFCLIDEKLDEEKHKSFFYATLNGKDLTV